MRTEGDTWDIRTSVGLTALGVATLRALESAQPNRIIDDEYAELFVRAAGEPHFLDVLADPPTCAGAPITPGFMGLRTKFFDDFFRSAADAGITQMVILAAGLDARAFRLDWPTGTTVFEIDRPEVLEFKDQVLVEHGATARADRRAVAVDLRSDWPAALSEAGADPDARTAWSAEGLLPYLPGAAQDALFVHIGELSPPGSMLAVETSPPQGIHPAMAQIAAKYLNKNPFGDIDPAELFYSDERADPNQWLSEHGWSVRAAAPSELAAAYGVTIPWLPEELEQLWRQPRYLSAVREPAPHDIA